MSFLKPNVSHEDQHLVGSQDDSETQLTASEHRAKVGRKLLRTATWPTVDFQSKQIQRLREVAGAISQGCLRAVTMWPELLPEKMSRCSCYRHKEQGSQRGFRTGLA